MSDTNTKSSIFDEFFKEEFTFEDFDESNPENKK